MKIGDLVKYKGNGIWDWGNQVGIVVRQIPGTDEVQVVRWLDGQSQVGYPKRQLELVSESR
tara:strand:- start:369 stop:551 length:183 start_codon:yes stop_codon:yes gene_type:complete